MSKRFFATSFAAMAATCLGACQQQPSASDAANPAADEIDVASAAGSEPEALSQIIETTPEAASQPPEAGQGEAGPDESE